MARAPETGYYFEPLTERLALVVEGSAFPSDDHWAYIGDPIDITAELAKLEVALRWPGVDPDELEVEFDTDFDAAVADAERLRREIDELGGQTPQPQVFDVGVEQLLAQAQALRDAAADTVAVGVTREQLEAAVEEPPAPAEPAPVESASAEPDDPAPAEASEPEPEVVVKAPASMANRVRVRVVAPEPAAEAAPPVEPAADAEKEG